MNLGHLFLLFLFHQCFALPTRTILPHSSLIATSKIKFSENSRFTDAIDTEIELSRDSSVPQFLHRRSILCLSSHVLAFLTLTPNDTVFAATPLTTERANDFTARAERAFRPRPPRLLRPRMNLDFAVLLMRSSYNAVDAIDIVPMDQFQRDFFLLRQAEYENYSDAIGSGAMVQGDLADPNYFDFISFAQYSTIGREMADPPIFFEEQQPVEIAEDGTQRFVKVVVKRDASLPNSSLPKRHSEIVGNDILDTLNAKFKDSALAIRIIESGSRPGATTLISSIQQLVNLFVVSGFAWSASASILQVRASSRNDAEGTQFLIRFTVPATLWSGQALKAKNAILVNGFALKTVKALLSRAGYHVVNSSVKYVNNEELSIFTIA